ncbi:DUF4249 domain-containing protein [Parabacteroides sp. PF5-9]|uniref:DUF4249 domain-containing protein n=1 Tax=Parabacteroides sp. PF5-9 TaxID=1742404 RepID=UPI00247600DA|nr:DUF4249 domain-containing protein [Parabacteroides sp. PF5-9]MDH6356585.1 hypothetical protein [Parabacteroides sp. PF5-9]
MKTCNVLFIIIISVFILSCQHRKAYDDIPFESKLVVEGWIEDGDVARVILTQSIPIKETVDSTNFFNYVIRSAMVIVSDGERNDTLRLKTDSHYLPPFVYVGEKIIGKQDGTYTLTIKYSGKELTAETKIPASVPIDKVNYTHKNPSDTIGNLSVEFTDPVDQQNYYQLATLLIGYDEIFIPALYGNISDRNFTSPHINFQITRGITIFPHTNFESHFTDGDHIWVKLRTMTKESFDFWNLWQNEIVNAQNPIFPANSNLKSNIKGDGIGIWGGYGQSKIQIVAK